MNPFNYPELQPSETFYFTCQMCGECCRNVNKAVMVESLDLYRMARHLKMDVADAADKYLEAANVAWGAPILLLQTTGADNACVFLQNGKCSIQPAKPRACRLYPLSVGPDDQNLSQFHIFNVSEKRHHNISQIHRTGAWVAANMRKEDREYIRFEYPALRTLGKIMRRIPRDREDNVTFLMIKYRFVLLETGQAFLPQFKRNMALLKKELELLANQK
jgi:Fe-S-cluster containining protein